MLKKDRPAGVSELPGVEDFTVDTADDLLSVLSPRAALWNGASAEWVFRGQAEATWELVPKSARDLKLFAKVGITLHHTRNGDADWSKSAALVKSMLMVFRLGLNRAGIAIPTLGPSITAEEGGRLSSMALPDADAFPLMALAQHHGLPTPMLDWSRRGLVAAYFASADAASRLLRSEQVGSHFSIWALQRRATDAREGTVLLTEAPGAGNPNMNAQAGVFTLSLDELGRPLDVVLESKSAFRRIHALAKCAGRVLRLLGEEGVTGASMFPGTDGVVRGMNESGLWDELPLALNP